MNYHYILGFCVIDAVVPIVFFLNVEFYVQLLSNLDITMQDQLAGRFKGIRFSDLNSAGGNLSLVYFFGIVLAINLYLDGSLSLIALMSSFVILLIGILLTGRIALLLLVLYSFYIVLIYSTRYDARFMRLLISLVATLALFFYLLVHVTTKYDLTALIDYAFELFLGENFGSTNSIGQLIKHHFNFGELTTFTQYLFGVGKLNPISDIGFSNIIHGIGFIGFFVLLYFLMYLSFYYIRSPHPFIVICIYLLISFKQTFLANSKSAFLMFLVVLIFTMNRDKLKSSK